MEKKSFSTSIKFGKYRTFLKNLTEEQKAIVKSCGFGSLLHFDCTEAPRSVAYLLAKCFDVATRTVKLQNGSSFELNAFVVHQVLGVPLGGRRIRDSASKTEKEIIANDTGTSTIALTIEQLINLVTRDLTGDKFARIFMLISLAIFLCPTSYGSASKHYYSAIAFVMDIPKYDWCSFILDWLVDGIVKF
ncbi:hypothetical protein BDA96_10G164700 [Sorghum bicolor]|uniref:Aminotransferase-like plant mobile domain-containing protein n=2 Tax=Sorghum bicolor TaxID=4558 RepID=A0A921Q2D0_SORBI|nr:hypothetical protein BDA96_10G164700 [Sorghum bicolor]OQU76329.1 hypothetical protein SORBI_3010G131101 [Sorghum bicolor]